MTDDAESLNPEQIAAASFVLPQVIAADVMTSRGEDWDATLTVLQEVEKAALGPAGGTRFIETMLLNQAIALQSLFGQYAVKIGKAGSESQFLAFAEVALKAQNQCRRTLMTLVDIRNPKRVAFIRQLNAAVNQQVNNGENSSVDSISGKNSESSTSELLEMIPSERLDTRTQSQAIRGDPRLEALDTQHRPENHRG